MTARLLACAWCAALVFGIWSGRDAGGRFTSAYYNREVQPDASTGPMSAGARVEYEFTAWTSSLAALWIFPADQRPPSTVVLSVGRAGEPDPFWSRTIAAGDAVIRSGGMRCAVDGLALQPGGRYVMTLAFPAAGDTALSYQQTSHAGGVLRYGGRVHPSAEPAMLWISAAPTLPTWPLVAGALLVVTLVVLARPGTRLALPAWTAIAACSVLVAAYGWQMRAWEFYGAFWPDGYPALGARITDWLRGAVSFNDLTSTLAQHRNGGAFFVPALIAAFGYIGLSLPAAYAAVNGLFVCIAAVCLWDIGRLFRIGADRARIGIALLFFAHACTIRAEGALQTDTGGLALTVVFAWALIRARDADSHRPNVAWLAAAGIAACAAALTRVALLPLLGVPIVMFVWSVTCERDRAPLDRVRDVIPTVVGAVLLLAAWGGLRLWESLALARAFAARPEFHEGFSWRLFAYATFWGLQVALAALVAGLPDLRDDGTLAMLVAGIAGLAILLGAGQIVPWLRYWTPIAVLGVIVCMRVWRTSRAEVMLLAGALAVVLNAWLLWHNPAYAF